MHVLQNMVKYFQRLVNLCERRVIFIDRILIADDDTDLLNTLEEYLQKKGYRVLKASSSKEALELASTASLDCIVLDVRFPDGDGLAVCESLRRVSQVPIIFLSAYAKEDDRIRGLMAGGDDFMAKPYSLRELELRIRIRVRRNRETETTDVLRVGELEVDSGTLEVRSGSRSVMLTVLEFDLLSFLIRHPETVFSYEQLYDRVWGVPINRGLHNLQMCVARVRQKLNRLCPEFQYIETVRGRGYRFRNKP